jgi:hypothetical protein
MDYVLDGISTLTNCSCTIVLLTRYGLASYMPLLNSDLSDFCTSHGLQATTPSFNSVRVSHVSRHGLPSFQASLRLYRHPFYWYFLGRTNHQDLRELADLPDAQRNAVVLSNCVTELHRLL